MRETRCCEERLRGLGAVGDRDKGGREPLLDDGLEDIVSGVMLEREMIEREEDDLCKDGGSATGSEVTAPAWRNFSSSTGDGSYGALRPYDVLTRG